IGLIHTDDDLYHQSLSVKELHAYIPAVLKQKGWKYKKVYSRLFWENKSKLNEDLKKTFGQHA
ncbi:MAG: hypothetical protein K2X86_03315, partial [Cytophagaceae bacterium]|nr:hypothetical protein [Cytophagaceae bacterium]